MRRFKNVVLGLVLFSFTHFVSGQNFHDREKFELGGAIDKAAIVTILESSTILDSRSSHELSNPQNSVFITQIGDANFVDAEVSSEDAIVDLEQRGFGNFISIDLRGKLIRYNFLQDGSNNKLIDFTWDNSDEISLNLSQKGNNNTMTRMGSNSIGDKLQVNMTGDKTVIVRNFK